MATLVTEHNDDIVPLEFSLGFFIALFLGIAWLALFPTVLVGYLYFTFVPFSLSPLNLLLLIPLFFLLYGVTLISSIIVTKTGFWIVHKRITPPIPGSYPFTMENPQTRAYIIKGNIKPFGRWLFHLFHLQFLTAIWLRCCGVKIGKNVRIPIHLQDEDFIKVGDNAFFSKSCQVSGHLMDQWTLTLSETVIGNNIIMEPLSGSVGGVVGDNSIFKQVTGAMKGQICKGNAIYKNIPCEKIGDNDLSPDELEALKQKIRKYDKTNFMKEKNAPIKISGVKLGLMKFIVVIGAILLAFIVPLLYSLLFSAFYSPTNHLLNILLLTLVPFVFLITLGVFLVGAAIIIKIFLSYYNKKAEIPEGLYELDDPRAKIFKIKYMLRMFGLRLVHGSPLRIADTFVMKFWGNVTLGTNIVIQDATIDPQYLELGDTVVVGGGARIHTHDIIEGKLYIKKVVIEKNVTIGALSHIQPGVEIVEGTVIAVLARVRKDQKCKRRALWVGQPAIELPIEAIKQSTGFKKRVVDDSYEKT